MSPDSSILHGVKTLPLDAPGIALVFLLGAGLPAAAAAQVCAPVTQDLLVVADPLAAMVRPRECSTVEQNPPDFSWPHVGGGPYTVSLTFPDGHTESRVAANNWLNWDKTLPAGSYVWTVTRSEVTSLPRGFTVSADAVPFVVPDMTAVVNQLLATPHPRGLPDGATLALMASQRAHALEILRGQVDAELGQALPASGQPRDGSTDYGSYSIRALWSLMAYVYDRTDIYRQDAKRRVLNLASWDPRGPTMLDDGESFYIAWVVTLGYDWLEPDLSADERDQVLSMLNTRIGDLYNWIIGAHGWPPGDPDAGIPPPLWQSPRDSHRQLWAELIAAMSTLLVGDLPAASTWVRELLPFTLNLTMPWSGEEGGHANGTAYSMWDVGGSLGPWYVLRWATCRSEQTCIDVSQKAWVRNYGRFLAYFVPATFPADPAVHDARAGDPGTPIGLFGDGFAQPQLFEERSRFGKGYTHFAPSALGCWYASGLVSEDFTRLEYLMSPPDTCPAPAAYPAGTPDSLYLPSIGWMAMHSDLSDLNRTSVYFKSSPPPFGAFNHQSADQNAFVVNAGGERLAIESGYFDAYDSHHWQYWVKRTRSKNAITFDGGRGQVAFEHLPDPFTTLRSGSIVRQRSTPRYDVVTGDATDAYNGALTKAVRTLVYLRPNTILVYDSLASDTPRTWEWNIHALNPFEMISSSSRVRVTRGSQSLCIDMLAGPPREFTPVSDSDFSSWGRSNDPTNDVSAAPLDPAAAAQYHGRFASTQPSTEAEFVALMRVNAPCDDKPPTATRTNGAWIVSADEWTLAIAAAPARRSGLALGVGDPKVSKKASNARGEKGHCLPQKRLGIPPVEPCKGTRARR